MTKEQLRILIGENIRKKRIARGISIEELATVLGITPGFLGLIERGSRGVTALNLFKLADIFKVPADSFFFHTQELSYYKSQELRKKISSLITDFSEDELNIIIYTAKGIQQMRTSTKPLL